MQFCPGLRFETDIAWKETREVIIRVIQTTKSSLKGKDKDSVPPDVSRWTSDVNHICCVSHEKTCPSQIFVNTPNRMISIRSIWLTSYAKTKISIPTWNNKIPFLAETTSHFKTWLHGGRSGFNMAETQPFVLKFYYAKCPGSDGYIFQIPNPFFLNHFMAFLKHILLLVSSWFSFTLWVWGSTP